MSECILDQYKVLNQACLDLARSQSLSQVFEMVTRVTKGLLGQYTGVTIIQYEGGNVYRMIDNSEHYEQFLSQMTDPKGMSAREMK